MASATETVRRRTATVAAQRPQRRDPGDGRESGDQGAGEAEAQGHRDQQDLGSQIRRCPEQVQPFGQQVQQQGGADRRDRQSKDQRDRGGDGHQGGMQSDDGGASRPGQPVLGDGAVTPPDPHGDGGPGAGETHGEGGEAGDAEEGRGPVRHLAHPFRRVAGGLDLPAPVRLGLLHGLQQLRRRALLRKADAGAEFGQRAAPGQPGRLQPIQGDQDPRSDLEGAGRQAIRFTQEGVLDPEGDVADPQGIADREVELGQQTGLDHRAGQPVRPAQGRLQILPPGKFYSPDQRIGPVDCLELDGHPTGRRRPRGGCRGAEFDDPGGGADIVQRRLGRVVERRIHHRDRHIAAEDAPGVVLHGAGETGTEQPDQAEHGAGDHHAGHEQPQAEDPEAELGAQQAEQNPGPGRQGVASRHLRTPPGRLR